MNVNSKNVTVHNNSNIDCGVNMQDENASTDYLNTITICSFWMEGVLLTATGMYVAGTY